MHQDATLELRVRTVKYFKDMWQVGHFLEEAAFKNISRSKAKFFSKQVHADLNELSDDEMRKLSLGPKAHQAQLL